MKRRCYDQRHHSYKNYGGRGIRICDEWLNDPQSFIEWSLAHGFSDELRLDRIDNDGPYSPDNCRWVTDAQNARNRRNTIRVSIDGVEMCGKDACAVVGIEYQAFHERIQRGWNTIRALIVPSGFKRPFACFNRGIHGGCHWNGRRKAKCPFHSDEAMRLCNRFVEIKRKEEIHAL